MQQDLIYIKSNFGTLPTAVTKLEATGLQLVDSLAIIEDVKMSLESTYGVVGMAAKGKLDKVINSNPDFLFIKTVKMSFVAKM